MKITKLELTHFGKFHHKTILMHDGCNLIYGPNEVGKTTIHTFIYGMLFGLDPARGRGSKNSLYARYLPWETPAQYDGKLWFEKQGCLYRIERCFLKEQRSLILVDETHGKALEPAAAQLSSLLSPLNEVLFRNTLSIRQLQTIPDADFAPQLENYIANLNMTRNAEIDITAAREELNSKKRSLRRTLHPEALPAKMQTENRCAQLQAELISLARQLDEKERRLAQLTAQIAEAQAAVLEQSTARKEDAEPYDSAKADDPPLSAKPLSRLPAIACYLLCLIGVLISGAILFRSQHTAYLPYLLAASWAFLLIAFILDYIRIRQSRKLFQDEPFIEDTSLEADAEAVSAAPAPDLAVRLNTLQTEQEQEIREQTRLQLLRKQTQDQLIQEENRLGSLTAELEQDRQTETELRALELAVSRLEQLSGQIQHSYGTDLNAEISGLLSKLTQGRYTSLVLNEDLHITLNTEQKLIAAEQLSRGTLEQIYFCLRIASAKLLSPNEPFPFLFDDIFAFYDDERLGAALQLLTELNTQVILFSCHKREQEIMKKLKA